MITLLTCTGDRPESFARLERYMARQTLRWSKWIVVDDGHTPTVPTLGQAYIRLPPGKSPKESFAANYRLGLECARASKYVAIIEDDDWYAPQYLTNLIPVLYDHELAGESQAKYYHVPSRRYRFMGNGHHASLCQTAFRGELIPRILPLLSDESAFLDVRLWNLGNEVGDEPVSKHLRPSVFSVGLKGLPGRAGIGCGHRPQGKAWKKDKDGSVLREWIGEDAGEVLDGSEGCDAEGPVDDSQPGDADGERSGVLVPDGESV